METYKKQKKRYQLCLFLFSNDVDLKNNWKVIENPSQFSGCAKAGINLFPVDFYKPWNELRYCYEKAPILPLLLWKDSGGIALVIPALFGVPVPAGHMRPSDLFCDLRELSRLQKILQKQTLQIINCRSRFFPNYNEIKETFAGLQ